MSDAVSNGTDSSRHRRSDVCGQRTSAEAGEVEEAQRVRSGGGPGGGGHRRSKASQP